MLPQSSSRVVAPVLANKNTRFLHRRKRRRHTCLAGCASAVLVLASLTPLPDLAAAFLLRHGGCLTGRLLGSTFTDGALRRKLRSSDAQFLRRSLFALPRKSQEVPSFLLLLSPLAFWFVLLVASAASAVLLHATQCNISMPPLIFPSCWCASFLFALLNFMKLFRPCDF